MIGMRKKIHRIKKHLGDFYKDNKMLSKLSLGAIGFVLFYFFSYDVPELWKNASVLVDILFQLSLAIIANLMFFIFQMYIPNYKRNIRIRPTIITKIKKICQYMNEPICEVTNRYLGKKKNLNELSQDDILKIAEQYRPQDMSTVQVAFICQNLTYNQYFKFCFDKIDETIQELIFTYAPYLSNTERDILPLIKEHTIRQFLGSPLMDIVDSTGIQGDAFLDTFQSYKNIYIKALELRKS